MNLRSTFTLVAFVGLTASAPAWSEARSSCSDWSGKYGTRLWEDDTFANDKGVLTLTVSERVISWTVTGAPSPIIIESTRFRCSKDKIVGKFPETNGVGSGSFTLSRRGTDYIFDASDVGTNEDSPVNYLGYVPNRPVHVRPMIAKGRPQPKG